MILINKVAVITGAKSGIGLATAKRFALEGARVILSDIRMANKETERIKHNGGEAFFFQVDVSKAQEVESLFEEAINKYGRLDILVNNAGIELAKNIPETSIEEWDHLMDVNLKSVFLCSKAAIPIMKRQRTGVIVNVASELGLVGGSEMAAYCASKGGVVQLTRAMAIDHASDHIRVNCVCPGPIETPLLERIITAAKNPKEERAHIIESIPLGRIGKPEEIAGVILFLASDESSFMTGAAVAVDGGWSAR
jgi:NAD(P)-dependent dehydrogenase (short-subunit alcohol dehydrogenase family)